MAAMDAGQSASPCLARLLRIVSCSAKKLQRDSVSACVQYIARTSMSSCFAVKVSLELFAKIKPPKELGPGSCVESTIAMDGYSTASEAGLGCCERMWPVNSTAILRST